MVDVTEPAIPQSLALAEATTDSLAELMSRDPNRMSDAEFAQVVEVLRAQRPKWQAAEAAGRPKAAPKAASAKAAGLITQAKPGDLGL